MPSYDKRVAELGLELPPAPRPQGVYTPFTFVAPNLLYISGHGGCPDSILSPPDGHALPVRPPSPSCRARWDALL